MRHLLLFGIVVLLGLLQGCKPKKTTPPLGGNLNPTTTEYPTTSVIATWLPEWFTAKANIGITSPELNQSATASIRMRKDSIIWMSIRKFGIEVARMQITQDTVWMLDRINSQCHIYPTQNLVTQYGIPSGNFSAMQDLILGNPIMYNTPKYIDTLNANEWIFIGEASPYQSKYCVRTENKQLQSQQFVDTLKRQSFSMLQEEYLPLATATFSQKRRINAQLPAIGSATIQMDFSEITYDQAVNLRFEIPDYYEVIRP
ncbi:MAG: DUF4292 domain-containing protein [Saprospiraceae bacterium]|nr:DUF4292 domain-containing protein [Saprospiraceae bacterium]MBP7699864.1 DUF4292 domain-containing protein [Saprospiraceae bacterium]